MMQRLDVEAASGMRAWLGADISSDKFSACLLLVRKVKDKYKRGNNQTEQDRETFKTFQNAPAGYAQLLRWIESQAPGLLDAKSVHFCMEATGSYSDGLAMFLVEAGQPVSVVNPAWIKHSGLSTGRVNKTDPADGRLSAHYARKERPALWRMAAPEVRTLTAMVRRLQSLTEQLVQEKNRLAVPGLVAPVKRSIQASIRFLDRHIQELEAQVKTHIDQHPGLKQDRDLLLSIPGVGDTLAHWIMAELPDVAAFKAAKSAAAYAGLNPRLHESGTSVHKRARISKAGNRNLRQALYMPALSAIRFNPAVKEIYTRLIAKGMAKKAALCAAMRKLLMIAYGVLKNRQMFTLTPKAQTA
jgi:transposase